MSSDAMACPKCGSEMNQQAQKLVHPVTREETAKMTPAFDGVILVVFACPGCGWIDSRRQGSSSEPS